MLVGPRTSRCSLLLDTQIKISDVPIKCGNKTFIPCLRNCEVSHSWCANFVFAIVLFILGMNQDNYFRLCHNKKGFFVGQKKVTFELLDKERR